MDELTRWHAEQAHAYLERIRRMGEDCAGLQQQVDDAYSRASGVKGIDYSAIRVQFTANDDAMVNAIESVRRCIRDYTLALAEYEEMRHGAYKALQSMADQTEARVLRMRYLLGCKWERICVDMGYSWDGMMKLRRRALASFYGVMPMEYRDKVEPAI